MIFNYNNPNLSRDINCKVLGDCSGNTISANGAEGISALIPMKLSDNTLTDLFHLGLDATAIFAAASLVDVKYRKQVLIGAAGLTLAYYLGRAIKASR